MAIIGFSFVEFKAKRNQKTAKGNIEVKHNISIANAAKTSLNLGGNKNEVLRVEFAFDVIYGQDLGKIAISGDLLFSDTKEIIGESEKMWKKDKTLPDEVKLEIHRFLLGKGLVKALELSDALNLPTPIPLPKIALGAKKKK